MVKACIEYVLFYVKLFLPNDQSNKRVWDWDTMICQNYKKKQSGIILFFSFIIIFVVVEFDQKFTFISCNPFSLSFAMFVVFECDIFFLASYNWHKDFHLSSSSVMRVLTLLKSEVGWTGVLWLIHVLLILEN